MKIFSAVLFLLHWLNATAQINFPRASPACSITQTVGLTDITIDYCRPGTKGRKIFGEIVPYGRIWRVGANESTKMTITQPIKINNHQLPAGTYALYAIPQADNWTMVVHRNITHWGDGRDDYDANEDAFRFEVKVKTLKKMVEDFTIDFQNLTHSNTDIILAWENTLVSFTITVDTRKQVLAEIQEKLKEPTADTYYQAARYFQEEGLEPQQALEWLDSALALAGDTYYIHRVKSLIQAELGNYADAIQSAKQSLSLAAGQNKDEFVRMNQKNISKWEALIKP